MLGLQVTATAAEVTKAWRRKMLTTHPDKCAGDAALELSKELNDAKDRALAAVGRKQGGGLSDAVRKMQEEHDEFMRKMAEDRKKWQQEMAQRKMREEQERQRQAEAKRQAHADMMQKQQAAHEERMLKLKKERELKRRLEEERKAREELERKRQMEAETARLKEEAERLKKLKEEEERLKQQAHEARLKRQREMSEGECVKEFKAHARGEEGGLHRLKRVCLSILREHSVPPECLHYLLHDAGLYVDMRSADGCFRRKRLPVR
jgi:curved DNA-binding protein CbpA